MKRLVKTLLFNCSILAATISYSVEFPKEWSHHQLIFIDAEFPALATLKVPFETSDLAQPFLSDLRIYSESTGKEIPYILGEPKIIPTRLIPSKTINVQLKPQETLIEAMTGSSEVITALYIQASAETYLKAIQIEGTLDGKTWIELAKNQPVFYEDKGMPPPRIALPKQKWKGVRLRIDDSKTVPIAVNGLLLELEEKIPKPTERLYSGGGATEQEGFSEIVFAVRKNTFITELEMVLPDTIFNRRVEVFSDGKLITQDVIYRIKIPNEETMEKIIIPIRKIITTQNLTLRIINGTNTPLRASQINVDAVPYTLTFLSEQRVTRLLVGNKFASAPTYDIAGLTEQLKSMKAVGGTFQSLAENDSYKIADPVPDINEIAGEIDIANWTFRKEVVISTPGIQILTLDWDTIAEMKDDGADLRLVKGANQAPFILKLNHWTQVDPQVVSKEEKGKSIFLLKFPKPGLPIKSLSCGPQDGLFRRRVQVLEKSTDERGDSVQHVIGQAIWDSSTPESKTLHIQIERAPQSDQLFLIIHNDDNASIGLPAIRAYCRAPQLIFKASTPEGYQLYYGNESAKSPAYDINLASDQLERLEKNEALLKETSTLAPRQWWDASLAPGYARWIFWIVLAGVLLGLLYVIVKLLPPEVDNKN